MRAMHGPGGRLPGHGVRREHGPGAGVERARAGARRYLRGNVRQQVVDGGRAGDSRARRAARLRRVVSRIRTAAVARAGTPRGEPLPHRPPRQQLHGPRLAIVQRQDQGGALHEVYNCLAHVGTRLHLGFYALATCH